MPRKIILSMFTLLMLTAVALTYARNKQTYAYKFPLNIKSSEQINEDFKKQFLSYQKTIKRNPASYHDMAMIAQICLAHGKSTGTDSYLETARSYANKSIQYSPFFNTRAYFVLAEIAHVRGQFPKSIIYAQTILKEKPRSPEAFLILVNAYLALGNLTDANRYADDLISVMPTATAFTLRAVVLSNQGRFDEALLDFEDALRVEEDAPEQASFTRVMYARFYLTNYYSKKGSQHFAEILLKESLRINPHSHIALGLMGDLFEKKGRNYNAAIKYYKAAFKESKHLTYLLKEARAHKLLGEEAFALALFKQTETLLRHDLIKNRNGRHSDLIRLLLERGNAKDYPEALWLAQHNRKIKANPESLILLSWAMEMNNHLIEARRVVREVLARNFRTEEVYLRAMSIEEKLNNINLAKLYRSNFMASSN